MADRLLRLVLVSVPKSGTHLASRLVENLGYRLVWRLFHEVPVLEASRPNEFGPDRLADGDALVVHRLSADRMSPRLYVEWTSGKVGILFNIRDPRDILLSSLDFLLHKRDLAMPFPGIQLLMDVIARTPGRDRQLELLMEDVTLPMAGPLHPLAVLRDMRYLTLHPKCHVLRFEDLVGPRGGGSRERQLRSVRETLAWCHVDGDPDRIVEKLYAPDAPMFNVGQSERWREELSAQQRKHFADAFGELLAAYGYE